MMLAYMGALFAVVVAIATVSWVVKPGEDSTPASGEPATNTGIPVVDVALTSDGRAGRPLALVSGAPMFPLPGGGVLTGWRDVPVVAQDVPVQSLAKNGFWMGSDEVQRVFVTIPNSAVERGSLALDKLQIGQQVNVTGRMQQLPENVFALGLDDATEVRLKSADGWLVANNVRSS